MSVTDLHSKIGTEMKIMPAPEEINAKRQLVVVTPNEWRIESVQEKRVELKNYQTGHIIMLSERYIRAADQNKLDLRFKIVLKGKRTVF
ncbi:MAG TPA: hypothetical protein VGJ57_10965 [Nitrospirales bacterium]|jgi:hypothetical protein